MIKSKRHVEDRVKNHHCVHWSEIAQPGYSKWCIILVIFQNLGQQVIQWAVYFQFYECCESLGVIKEFRCLSGENSANFGKVFLK